MVKAAAVDFDSLDTGAACEKPYEVELTHPTTSEPLGVFVSVLGPESAAFKNCVRREINRSRRKEFEAKRKGKDAEPQRLEDDEQFGITLVAEVVIGWRTVIDGKSEPVVVWKGEKLDFNADNLNRWLAHFPWVRKQISDASGELEHYLGNLLKS